MINEEIAKTGQSVTVRIVKSGDMDKYREESARLTMLYVWGIEDPERAEDEESITLSGQATREPMGMYDANPSNLNPPSLAEGWAGAMELINEMEEEMQNERPTDDVFGRLGDILRPPRKCYQCNGEGLYGPMAEICDECAGTGIGIKERLSLQAKSLELHCTGCGVKVDYDFIEHDYSTGDPYCEVCRPDLFNKSNEDDPRAER